jgi:hypothetical protein
MSIYEIPLPFDVLVAATKECIYGYAPGVVEYTYEDTLGRCDFQLSYLPLGKICELVIRKTGDKISEIHFKPVKKVYLSEAEKYLKRKNPTEYEKLKSSGELRDTLKELQKDLFQKKKTHLKLIRKGYFSRLVKERIWEHAGVKPPPYIMAVASEVVPNAVYMDKSGFQEIQQGIWKNSNVSTLDGALVSFSNRYENKPFGIHEFKFIIMDNPVYSKPVIKSWMIAKYDFNRDTLFSVDLGNGTLDPEGGWPYGEIRVRETADGLYVTFWLLPNHPDAIGPYIQKLIQQLGVEGMEHRSPVVEDEERDKGFEGLPKTKAALDRWKKAYSAIDETREYFLNRYDELEIEDPNPSYEDYIDSVKKAIKRKYSERTIRNIIKAGDNGSLD